MRESAARDLFITDPSSSWSQRLRALWIARRAPLAFFVAACLLATPSLTNGLQADDWQLLSDAVNGAPPWLLLDLTPASAQAQRDYGALGWWMSPRIEAHLFRPLACLWHSLDFALWWPSAPWVMHAENIAIYAALVALAALLYRRFFADHVAAAIATALYGITPGLAFSSGWISGRNTVLQALFTLLTLHFHVEYRERGLRLAALLSVACLAIGLGWGEGATAGIAVVAAYELTLRREPLARRALALLPLLGLGLIWLAFYASIHGGVHGAGSNRELARPVSLLVQGIGELPLWVVGLFGPPAVTIAYSSFDPNIGRLIALPFALGLLWLFVRLVKRSELARFFACFAALSLLPLLPTQPQERLLLIANWGSCGLMAHYLRSRELSSRFGRGYVLVARLGLAALFFFPMLNSLAWPTTQMNKLLAALPREPESEVVLINSPFAMIATEAHAALRIPGFSASPVPASMHGLYAGASPLQLTRIDARTLEIRAERGFLATPAERYLTTLEDMPRTGFELDLRNLHVSVKETRRGLPLRVWFRFPSALEDPQRRFLVWRDAGPERWTPIELGQRIDLAAPKVF